MELTLVEKAARLVYFGLSEKLTVTEKNEYLELYQEYKKDVNFRKVMIRIAGGFHLDILNIDSTGIYLRAHSKSIFSYSLTNLRKFTKDNNERIYLIIFIGLASYVFPRNNSFEEESSFNTLPITIHEFENYFRDKCKEILGKLRTKGHKKDDPDTELLLTSYMSLPTAGSLEDKSRNTSYFHVKKALKFLVASGFFIKQESEYFPTKRFFHHMESLSENEQIKIILNEFEGV